MCEILAFVGSEGAPGRTALAWNMAAALGRLGFTVTIVDAGKDGGNLGSYLGIEPPITVGDWLSERCSVDDVTIPIGERVSLAVLGESACTGGQVSHPRVCELSRRLADRDFIVLDTDRGTIDDRLPLIESASEVFAVVTPDQVAGTEALFFVSRLYRSSSLERISLILNRAPLSEIAEVISSRLEHDLRRILRVPAQCVAHVPDEPLMAESMQSGMTLIEFAPQSLSSERILEAAQRIADSRTENGELTWLVRFVRALVLSYGIDHVTESPSCAHKLRETDSKAEPDRIIPLVTEILRDLSEEAQTACIDFPGLPETARTLT